jgi:hypothetical protein
MNAMTQVLSSIEARLASLPVPVAVILPSGQRAGPADAQVVLHFQTMSAMASLAAGQIGTLGGAIVEGMVRIDGRMRDVMAVAASLLQSDPVRGTSHWWGHAMARMRSMAAHTLARDAQQIQFHYDISDDFYGLWLDPRRVYSCAYFRDPQMTLAQAQEAKLDHICRKLDLRPGERFLDIGAGWGALLLWAAHSGGLGWPPVLLYLSGIAWTLFYDTIYAHQDREDDALIGVKSTARLFGHDSARWLAGFMAAATGLMALAVLAALLPGGRAVQLALALAGVAGFGLHMAWQLRRLDTDDPARCLILFRSNRDAGLIVALFLAAAALA